MVDREPELRASDIRNLLAQLTDRDRRIAELERELARANEAAVSVRYEDWWTGGAESWVQDETTPGEDWPRPESIVLWHLDGVAWHDRKPPRRWHRCRASTRALVGLCEGVERCACGAIRRGGPGLLFAPSWMERNTR